MRHSADRGRALDGRRVNWTLVLLVLVIGMLVVVSFFLYGYINTWRLWNLPVMWPPFADLRSITGGAESQTLGHDPLYFNPKDPWHRPMNYPRIWQLSFALGINQAHTKYIGAAFAVLFFLAVLILFVKVDNITLIPLIPLIFSPAVMLALERGNSDLLVFFLLALALVVGQTSPAVAAPIILTASILKLYPIFGAGYFLREKGKVFIVLSALSIGSFILYVLLSFKDMAQIYRVTPRVSHLSYGLNVLWMWVRGTRGEFLGAIARCLSYIAAGLTIAVGVWLRFRKRLIYTMGTAIYMDAFRIGAGIFLGTFLLGNSWDYRLLFLLLVVPQLVVWARKGASLVSSLSKLLLPSVFLTCWFLVISKAFTYLSVSAGAEIVVNETVNWIIFAGLMVLFICTVPESPLVGRRNWTDRTKVA